MIELAVLGLLKEGPMHGYELKKRLRDVLPSRSSISFGSLYPALSRLEREGAVAAAKAATSVVTPAMPMTGSFAGEAAAFRASRRIAVRGPRNKKVYDITPAGEARLGELIADPSDDERSFPVKLAFCRFADADTRVGLLERRRVTLVERLHHGRRTVGTRSDALDRYVRSLLEHDNETTERDIAWIDGLLSAERTLAAGDPAPTSTTHDTAAPLSATHTPSPVDGHEPAPAANGGTR
ncbi:MAG: PadR family transcriptional regulator [Acidimicrobiales bacterium]